ncbi:hypothetical protein SAMN05443144_109150 [Fodinibius roseus]|uniref:Uncharacterized protein n=1 Tax=Fodinibius roseus TaxID=1194090 RepID=A0A1M5C9M1_9BACT|nr:hypothetical protein [Fodinibius roseus]SHF51428.1 hypothetical protein SAMN05443144_109150 [Fodinibius roseus]
MLWFDILLMLTSGYAAFELIKFAQGRGRLKFLGLTIAAFIFTFMEATAVIGGFFATSAVTAVVDFIVEWGHLICLAFILSALAIFIRESKPVFAQFPLIYTALPLFIIISYFFVYDSIVLKKWMFFLYQGGALMVSLMMYGLYSYRSRTYVIILAGIGLFFLAYILFWSFSAEARESLSWLWKLVLAGGIVTTVLGYKYAHNN